jgi:hypothetical protein
MPGANYSIFGCTTNRKHVGVGIFKIPAETDELLKKTREARISVITKDRSVDESLRRQINSGNLHVCERHFRKEEYEYCIKVCIRDLMILGRQRDGNGYQIPIQEIIEKN